MQHIPVYERRELWKMAELFLTFSITVTNNQNIFWSHILRLHQLSCLTSIEQKCPCVLFEIICPSAMEGQILIQRS